ncbi:unnamed protein product, partial [Choristocarpus tenellus]
LVDSDNDLGGLEETHSSSSDSDKEEPGSRRRGWPRPTLTSGNHGNLFSVQEGRFAFFVATEAPLLVGKILAERVSEDGESGVDIHWLRPTSDHTRDNAATLNLEKYGKSSFVESWVQLSHPVQYTLFHCYRCTLVYAQS